MVACFTFLTNITSVFLFSSGPVLSTKDAVLPPLQQVPLRRGNRGFCSTSCNCNACNKMAPSLPATMRAAVLREVKGQTKCEDIKMPVPAAGEVLIKNTSAGICHTDLHAMDGHIGFPIPAVFGHEVK